MKMSRCRCITVRHLVSLAQLQVGDIFHPVAAAHLVHQLSQHLIIKSEKNIKHRLQEFRLRSVAGLRFNLSPHCDPFNEVVDF